MALRSLIVDDEPAARELLAEMLRAFDGVEVVASCGDGRSALETIRAVQPDVVFLDIQMPRGTGLEVVEWLEDELPAGSWPPVVVFVTAYDEFAVRAFDASAADYLLKPFDEERLGRAVERAADRVRARAGPAPAASSSAAGAAVPGLEALLAALRERGSYLRRLPVRVGERIVLVRVDDVCWFEADGKHVRLHGSDAGGKATALPIRHTMQALERRLDPERFVRVSRSAIVNLDHVRHAEGWSHGEYVLVLRNGERVVTTHGYRAAVQRVLREP